MEKIAADRRRAPDTRRGDFDLAPGMEIIGRHRSKAALEAAMQLTVASTAAYLSSPTSGAHLTEQNIARLNRIRKQLVTTTPLAPIISPPGTSAAASTSTTTTTSTSTTKTSKKSSGSKRGGGKKVQPPPPPPAPVFSSPPPAPHLLVLPPPPPPTYFSEFNQRFERLFADFDRFYVADLGEEKHARPLEEYCRGEALYQAVVGRLLEPGRLSADFEALFGEGSPVAAERAARNGGEPFAFTGGGGSEGASTPTSTGTGLRASARIRRHRSSSDEWNSSTPSTPNSYSSHNGGTGNSSPAAQQPPPPGSPNVHSSNRSGKRPLPPPPPPLPASPVTRQNGNVSSSSSSLSRSGFKIPRIGAAARSASSNSTSTPIASSTSNRASNPENHSTGEGGSAEVLSPLSSTVSGQQPQQQPPSPNSVFNELFCFTGLMTRHQMKALQDTINENRQEALNSSCKSSDSLEASLRSRQQEYLRGVLKRLQQAGAGESQYTAADRLLKENAEASWSLLRLLNDHLALFSPQCYGCLASEKDSTKTANVEGRLIASPGKGRRGGGGGRGRGGGGGGPGKAVAPMVNGFATAATANSSSNQGGTASSSSSSTSKVFNSFPTPPITRSGSSSAASSRKRSLTECSKGAVFSRKIAPIVLGHILKQQETYEQEGRRGRRSSSSSSVSADSSSVSSASSEGGDLSALLSEKSSAKSSSSSNNSSRRGSSSSNGSNGSSESKVSSNGVDGEEDDIASFDSRHQRQLPCPELEEAFDMAALVTSWESASEAHGKVLAKSNSGGGGGGGSSSRDYGYHHHHNHYNNHHHHHQNTSLLDPSMLVDDEHIRELHRRRTAAGASKYSAGNKLPATQFVGLGELGLQKQGQGQQQQQQQPFEEAYSEKPYRKFFPIPSEDVPCLRSHDPFGIIDSHHHHSNSNNVAESPRTCEQPHLNGGSSGGRRRFSNSFEEDCFKDEKLMGMMAATEFNGNSNGNNGFSSSTDDLGSTIKQLTGQLASVTRATSRTVGDLWVKTQQELALQELREKTENHHALLCHEFTPYFSMKRKQMMNINGSSGGGGSVANGGGLVPTATRNNILTTMANLSEDKSGADRIRREMGVAEYIDEVFRLRQSTLVAAPPTQPSTSSDGGQQSGHSAEGNGN